MRKRILLVALVLMLLGSAVPEGFVGSVSAATCTTITSLPYTISASGCYVLGADFAGVSGTAITIQADNVVLDGGGHWVNGTGSGYGVDVENVHNITLKNMKISSFYDGVYISHVSDGTVTKSTIINNSYVSIYLYYSSNVTIENNNMSSNEWYGIYIKYSDYNVISNNTINSNTRFGILMYPDSNNNVITYNTINNNSRGIQISDCSNNIITGNVVSGNGDGILVWSSSNNNTLSNNVITNNEEGISVASSSQGNIIYLNYLDNTRNVYSDGSGVNRWYSPERLPYEYEGRVFANYLGNYWSDYTGFDTNDNGIGESNYTIDPSNVDEYPLVDPTSAYNILSCVVIDSLPYTINQSGCYVLGSDFTGVSGGITIQANNVVLYGAQHWINGTGSGYGVHVSGANNVTVRGLKISNFYNGVYLSFSSEVTFANNTISGNGHDGVYLYYSSDNRIENNTVTNNGRWTGADGIELLGSNNNLIAGNTISGTSYSGISLKSSLGNTVANNTASNNGHSGIYMNDAHDTKVENNTVTGNNYRGIRMRNSCSNIRIANNLVTDNGMSGIEIEENSRPITIANNTISNNGDDGIRISSSEGNTVASNTISGNGDAGVHIVSSDNGYIENNTFVGGGLFVEDSYNNSVVDNTINGKPLVYLEGASGEVIDYPVGQVILVNSNNITVSGVTITRTNVGMELWGTTDSTIRGNTFTGNDIGVYVSGSNGSVFYLNQFDNTQNVYSDGSGVNRWYSPEKLAYEYRGVVFADYLGNYWSDYAGSDTNGDGIGESPYSIDSSNTDDYPLVDSTSAYSLLTCEIIDSLPYTISASGCYVLGSDFNVSETYAVEIQADNVALYGAGHLVNSTYSGYGMTEGVTAENVQNVTVRNLRLNGFDIGVYFRNVALGTIEDNTINTDKNYAGISIGGSSGTTIAGNSLFGGGLSVGDSYHNTVVNNTVNGKPLVYLEGASGEVITGELGQLIIVNSTGIHVTGVTISGTNSAIFLRETSNTIITDSSIINNSVGIEIILSDGNVVSGNVLEGNGNAVYTSGSSNNMIINNVFRANNVGIALMPLTSDSVVANNTITGGDDGISMDAPGAGNVIANNTISNNTDDGIYGDITGEYITISRNIIVNNGGSGIGLPRYTHINITGNTICNNRYGISFWHSSNNTIYNNVIANNSDAGISIYSSSDNVIYLNYLNNTQNVYSDGSGVNRWYSPELIEYAYRGGVFVSYLGNYWSDYAGSDTNGDGIGDSNYTIDSNNTDEYPLVSNPTEYQTPATLTITSNPSGADVYINGTYEGTTPTTLTLAPGTYEVTLSKEDYENYTTTVTFGPGENITVSANLVLVVGYLTVYSTPSGAEVYVDGSPIGGTPIEDYKLSTGLHEVRIVKADYEEYLTNVTVEPGENTVVNVTLTPKPATLRVVSDPSGAEVYINGTYEGITPLNLTLQPGTYEVLLSKEDYENYTTTVTLGPNEVKSLNVTLTPTFGYLTVYSTPSSAEVYVDGVLVGTTPLENYKLPTGRHGLRIVKENYEEYSTNVTINPGETTVVNVTLTPKPATLTVVSDPSGAEVYINGTYKGITPVNITLQPGAYEVALSKDEYENYTATVTLGPNEVKSLNVTLTPKFGYLTVYSTPSGAEVYVDGSWIGQTPVEGYKLPTGQHGVKIVKEDYEEYSTNVTVEPGKTAMMNVTLTPKPATLTVVSDPSGAEVYINGTYKGTTPLTLTLTPGAYEVTLSKEDYENYSTTVALRPNENRTLNVVLIPMFGYLTVNSTPSGAKVYVDDSLIGQTPVEDYKLSTGLHGLRIVKENYEEYSTNVTINPGETTVVNVTLTPKPATLTVVSDPSGAEVYINGTYQGVTPVNITLQPGTYEVKLAKEDYENYTVTVTLGPNENRTLNVTLTPTFGYLTVYSTPSSAEVYVDGSLIGETPIDNYKLSTGQHGVRIVRENYWEYSTNVTVEPGETTVVNVTLTPKPATLRVVSDPSGASVYINGTYRGITPLNLSLQPGAYEVRLSREDYENYTTTVTLGPNENRTLNVTLIPTFGYLTVYSTPANAEVYVDGVLIGRTPIEGYKLPTGRHGVRVVKSSYDEYSTNVTIEPGEPAVINTPLHPKLAILEMGSNPTGAEVYLEGVYKGTTPLSLILPAGTYRIVLVKDGYETYSSILALKPGKREVLNVTLTPKFGYLTVYSTPADAEVYIDGLLVGTTPLVRYNLSAGQHGIKVVKEDCEEYSRNITIEPGETAVINATLAPKPSGLPSILRLISLPSGARVYLNGTYEGTAPLNLTLAPGTYEVKLSKEEYENYTITVTLGSNENRTLNVALTPKFGYISVYSIPSGAEVYVDGSSIGEAPIRGYKLSTGRHELRIVTDNYEEYLMNVTVGPGENTVVNVTLTPKPAILEVASNPSGAEVYINETYKGTTPLNLTLQPGTYNVKLSKAGYRDYETVITVSAGEAASINRTLNPVTTTTTTATTTTTVPSASSSTSNTGGNGVCGPAGILVLALLPAILRRRE